MEVFGGFLIISALIALAIHVVYVGCAGIIARLGKDWAIISVIAIFFFPAVIFVDILFYPDGRRYLRQLKAAKHAATSARACPLCGIGLPDDDESVSAHYDVAHKNSPTP